MTTEKVHGTFVSEKVSKVRWKPEDTNESHAFVSGSWDDEEACKISMWMYPPNQDDVENYPNLLCTNVIDGDITEIKFVSSDKLIVSSSLGSVQLFKIVDVGDAANTHFKQVTHWEKLHYFRNGEFSPCTGLVNYMEDVATVGEDGRIILLNYQHKKPVRIIESADSCSIRCICFLRHNEILTGNLRGQMKVWDLRKGEEKPTSTIMLSGEQLGASCITQHPTQQHTVLAGGEDGSLTVWDLRQSAFPVTLLSAHSGLVSEMLFHPDRPEHLFTCSSSGEIWHWDTSAVTRAARPAHNLTFSGVDLSTNENPWLSSDAVKHRLEVCSLMPQLHKAVNSLDVNRDRVVVGCDNEALYVIKDVV